MLKKKPKYNLDNKDSNTGFNNNIGKKQIIINTYNTLIKILIK
jgi:hypothetical protein